MHTRGWKPEMHIPGEGWKANALVFSTEEEAELWARDLCRRWTVPSESRAVPTDKEPNYRRLADGKVEIVGGRADGAIVKETA